MATWYKVAPDLLSFTLPAHHPSTTPSTREPSSPILIHSAPHCGILTTCLSSAHSSTRCPGLPLVPPPPRHTCGLAGHPQSSGSAAPNV